MNISIAIAPSGRLRIEEDSDSQPAVPEEAAAVLRDEFARSNAAGLLSLVSQQAIQPWPAALLFWREFAMSVFQSIHRLGDKGTSDWQRLDPPSVEALNQLVDSAPPMRGLEYLNRMLLRSNWQTLLELVVAQANEFPQGAAAWLRQIHPLWKLLGRVTFHLAENKKDPQRPFAFLATYAHRVSQQAKLQHLPLAEALKAYAGAQEQAKLESLLQPVKLAAEYSPLVREMLQSRSMFAPQAWTAQQAYRFLQESTRIEDAGVVIRLPDWWSARRPPRPQVQVQIGSRPTSELGLDGLLDFEVGVAIDGEPLSKSEREQLLAGVEGLVLLRGKWIEVDRAHLQQALAHWQQVAREHSEGISMLEGMRLLAGARFDAGDAGQAEVAAWSRISAGDWLRQTLEQMRHPDQIAALQPGRGLRATLRPYQAEGVRWLWFMTHLRLGACLADDMGLGKTIQVIDLLLQRRAPGKPPGGPSLLVVPASLLGNWRQELDRFAPDLKVRFAHRSEVDDDTLARLAKDALRELADVDLLVTTYGLVRRQDWLKQVDWSLVVLDEAQAIKNAASAQTRGVKNLKATARIALTGTPVENHLGDLWSIFDFCCPGLLGTATQFKQFVKRLGNQQDAQAFGSLRRLVQPYILRRLKTDPQIAPDLPEKTEMRVECSLSKKQAALYQRAVEDLKRRLQEAEGIARKGLVLSLLMQLKQICNHPAQYLGTTDFSAGESGKFERLRLLCESIAERQEKVLVFTQFQSLTEPLCEYLATLFGRSGLLLHGGTAVRKRSELVKVFQDENGPPFFVISLKAGGSGLNLTAASHVIHFDRWWNPAVENQATDRAFRIGQKRNVLVHKFVTRGTVEERIDAMIRAKQAVADQLLNQESETQLTEMNDEELLRFVSLDISRAMSDE